MKSSIHITPQAVFKAAQDLIGKGISPTQESIRAFLGRGSRGTIHKYLKQWKEECFQKAARGEVPVESQNVSLILQEKVVLEATLARQIQKNEALSSELFSAEREIARLRETHTVEQQQLETLQAACQKLEKDYGQIKAVYEGMCLERDRAVAVVIEDKNRLLMKLQEELRETHQENLERIRDLSFRDDDLLMQEKIKSLNYEEKIKTLSEEVKKLAGDYDKAQRLLEPLKQEIAKQKKLIEDKLTFEQLAAHLPNKEP